MREIKSSQREFEALLAHEERMNAEVMKRKTHESK